MASIIKADDGVASGQTGIVYTADTTGTLELQATSGLVTLQNVVGGITIPRGTTAQRPASPIAGMIRYNTSTNTLEFYSGSAWAPVGSVYDTATNSTGYFQVSVGTTAQRPASPVAGMLRWNTTLNNLEVYTGSGWNIINTSDTSLGSSVNPGTSAAAILAALPSSTDGIYYINYQSLGSIPVYCMMSWGGYMLVAKIDDAQDNAWAYSGSNWSASTPLNESATSNTSTGDAINRLYYSYPIATSLRISFGTVSNYLNDTAAGGAIGKTAKACFTGSAMSSDNSRANFLSLMAGAGTASSNWDNQPNCNHAGFNVGPINNYAMRWGISMNNEADCSSNDSAVGLGCYTNNYTDINAYVRNCNAGGFSWNSDTRYPKQAFIWVK